MPIPTRLEIETVLASVPVGSRAKANMTPGKRVGRNRQRQEAVIAFVTERVENPALRKKIIDDLPSYQNWEWEGPDAEAGT